MAGVIWNDLLLLLGIALGAVLVMALLAPLESLGWYAGWRTRQPYERKPAPQGTPGATTTPGARKTPADHYVVFLSGIGDPSGLWHYPEETEFLRRLRAALPTAAVVDDLFAYSVTGSDIEIGTSRALLRKMWRGIESAVRRNQGAPIGALINVHNLFQVAVSVDDRYGPFFNLGQAENMHDALLAYNYLPGSGQRVVLIGYSGGAQVALGSAVYLNRMLGAPVLIVSVGGVMSSEPGCLQVEHLYHLWGARDPIQVIGDLAFVGRWPVAVKSAWNRARHLGKITRIAMGPVAHNGASGYFGPLPGGDGRPRIDHTLETMLPLITGPVPGAGGRP
jgi:pimeloyl-ACP methyl ester carboxylesterase